MTNVDPARPLDTEAFILDGRAGALANYPHARRVGKTLYVCGTSSRRPDNTHRGAVQRDDGGFDLDIREQTQGTLSNLREILRAAGTDLSRVVDVTCFLVDMADFQGFNEVYNRHFDAMTGPTRTTVAVHQLPHPNLLIEIKAVAQLP